MKLIRQKFPLIRKHVLHLFAVLLAISAIATPAAAALIAQDRTGVRSSRFQFYWGQSFTTPSGTKWNNVTFNFYDISGAPLALGTGYLFTNAYVGAPSGLGAAAAVAISAPGDGSVYSFAPGFVLKAATHYYFYEDTPMRLLGNGSANVGGSAVFALHGNDMFASAGPGNANFTVNGSAIAVPEPGAWLLLISGFFLVGVFQRRTVACAMSDMSSARRRSDLVDSTIG